MTEPFLITNKDKVLRALQLTQLEGLKEIDRVCRKHGIEYSLDGGTCLGRMRHGGFIPWDDDIDVDMTPDNYDKFMEIAPKEIDSDRFFLRCKKTDPNHYRSAAKLEIKGTVMEFGGWRNAKIKAGVFVDIFRTCYLPDDKELRENITHKLFMIHAVENHRMLGANTRALRDNYNLFWWIVSELIPIKWIMKWEDRIIDKYGRTKSSWMVDDAIANGDYGGYPAEGSDEFVDADFEGITVRDKKNADGFLSYQYGGDYNEWLPPAKRLSHHKWLTFDLGPYAEKFDIPANYEDYITVKYNEDKLKQMQRVSLVMAERVAEICRDNGLEYFVLNDCAAEIWAGPLLVGIPRKDYEQFLSKAETQLGKGYVLQHHGNTGNYYYSHAKVRLDYTELRDSRIPEEIDNCFHSGFYIDIVPLDNAPNDKNLREQQARLADRIDNKLIIKWTRNNLFRFRKSKFKTKIKILLLVCKTAEGIYNRLNREIQKYNNENTEYYLYSKCESRGFVTVPKTSISKGQKHEADDIESVIHKVSKRYAACFLNYYDSKEYQLSVIRYDEKANRLMTNEEIINA